jgi:hypothetical protein
MQGGFAMTTGMINIGALLNIKYSQPIRVQAGGGKQRCITFFYQFTSIDISALFQK